MVADHDLINFIFEAVTRIEAKLDLLLDNLIEDEEQPVTDLDGQPIPVSTDHELHL